MGLGGRRVGRTALTKGVGVAVLALLAIYALLGGDLGDLGLDDGSTTTTESQRTTSTVADAPTETVSTEAPADSGGQTPDGFSQEEVSGISDTLAAIEAGGELPYDQDGTTFQNREGLLPDREEGYYREYTVVTPGSDDRGARRLVIGSGGDTWYTRDHYDSFVQIDPEQFL